MDADEVRDEARAEKARREKARRRLVDFIRYVSPWWTPQPYHVALCERLEAVERGDTSRLMVMMPPRHGKSEVVSVHFPAWYLGRNPDKRVIMATYGKTLTERFSRRARDLVGYNARYRNVFPGVRLSPSSKSVTEWNLEGRRGGFFGASVGAALTGMGGDCVEAGTLVTTRAGRMRVDVLCAMERLPEVLAYNHAARRLEWRRVVAWRKKTVEEAVDVVTERGRVRCTPDHRFYVEGRGYVEAARLNRSDALLRFDLPELRRGEGAGRDGVPGLLYGAAGFHGNALLRHVRRGDKASAVPGGEGAAEGLQGNVLLARLPEPSIGEQGHSDMPAMRRGRAPGAGREVLLGGLPKGGATRPENEGLSGLRRSLPPGEHKDRLLLSEMRGGASLPAHARRSKPEVQGRAKLFRVVQEDEAAHPGARRGEMCGLRGDAPGRSGAGDPSHRRGREEQRVGESRNRLQELPQQAPQEQRDAVRLVRRVRGKVVTVYDLQVEGCHNFLADGILVHNCLLCDDPIKGFEAAESQLQRDRVADWYANDFYTRAEGDAPIVVCNTRWNEDDLSGRLLSDAEGDDWDVLKLPAIQPDGTALWPDKYPVEKLERIRSVMGERRFDGLYQNEPRAAKGNLFQAEWFEDRWHELPRSFEYCITFCDPALKESQLNDEYAWLTLMVGKDGMAYLLNLTHGRYNTGDAEDETAAIYRRMVKAVGRDKYRLFVEDTAGGPALMDGLRRRFSDVAASAAKAPDKDKVIRARLIEPYCMARRVKRPAAHVTWWAAFEEQLLQFPFGKHDDRVDAFIGAMEQVVKGWGVDLATGAGGEMGGPSW